MRTFFILFGTNEQPHASYSLGAKIKRCVRIVSSNLFLFFKYFVGHRFPV